MKFYQRTTSNLLDELLVNPKNVLFVTNFHKENFKKKFDRAQTKAQKNYSGEPVTISEEIFEQLVKESIGISEQELGQLVEKYVKISEQELRELRPVGIPEQEFRQLLEEVKQASPISLLHECEEEGPEPCPLSKKHEPKYRKNFEDTIALALVEKLMKSPKIVNYSMKDLS